VIVNVFAKARKDWEQAFGVESATVITTAHIRTFLFVSCLMARAIMPLLAQSKPYSCESNDPFRLPELSAKDGSSVLCTGIVDASSGRRVSPERELKLVIQQKPRTSTSYRAHEALTWMYFRMGQYRKANAQLEQILAEQPDADDAKSAHSLFATLAQYPDQAVAESHSSAERSETTGNNLFLPVTVNGVGGSYIIDTGSNISIICESEAHRMHLQIERTAEKVSGAGGLQSSYSASVADAPDLWIGRTHLRHVAVGRFSSWLLSRHQTDVTKKGATSGWAVIGSMPVQ
jgi:hypothetical protein